MTGGGIFGRVGFRPQPRRVFVGGSGTGRFVHPYPHQPERQMLELAPGEGKLLRLGGEGEQLF